jgi:hypothetical protein
MGWNKSSDQYFHLGLSIFSTSQGEWFMELGSRKQEVGNRKWGFYFGCGSDKRVTAHILGG